MQVHPGLSDRALLLRTISIPPVNPGEQPPESLHLPALLVAPWLIWVLAHHGVAPFRAALATGTHPAIEALSRLCSLGFLQTSDVALSPAWIAGIGCAVLLARREFFLPV